MDEFDKIRAFSKDIIEREEPSLGDTEAFSDKIDPVAEGASDAGTPFESDSTEEGIGLSGLREEYRERFGFSPIGEDDFEEKKLFSMKWHIGAISVFIGLFVVVIAGFMFLGDEAENPDELIVITARETPIKERPEHPGGMVIPDQEKQVYNRLRVDRVPVKVERLFPAPEQPVVPDTLISDKQLAAVLNEEPYQVMEEPTPAVSLPKNVVAAAVFAEPKKEQIPLPKKSDLKLVGSGQKTVNQEKSVPVPSQKPVLKTEKNKIATRVLENKTKISGSKAEKDIWRVQLMSSSNKETVEKAWPKILKKNKALLSNMSYEIKSVDIEGRGTFYRLRVGSFKSRDMAVGLCQKLKANKQDCVPSK